MIYKYIGNVKILIMSKNNILKEIKNRLYKKIKTRIYFVNTHCFNIAQNNKRYNQNLNNAEIVLNDGIGIEIGAKLFKIELKENLNGTDFTPEVLQIANDLKLKVYLFGGKPGIAEKAGKNIQNQFPNTNIVGYSDGFFMDSNIIIEHINSLKPDILIVGLGVPLQEDWISDYFERLDVTIIMAVGAYLDFTSETIKRAPLLIRKVRMEWVFRLIIEPKRLWKRYIIGNVSFFYYIYKQKRSEKRKC